MKTRADYTRERRRRRRAAGLCTDCPRKNPDHKKRQRCPRCTGHMNAAVALYKKRTKLPDEFCERCGTGKLGRRGRRTRLCRACVAFLSTTKRRSGSTDALVPADIDEVLW